MVEGDAGAAVTCASWSEDGGPMELDARPASPDEGGYSAAARRVARQTNIIPVAQRQPFEHDYSSTSPSWARNIPAGSVACVAAWDRSCDM